MYYYWGERMSHPHLAFVLLRWKLLSDLRLLEEYQNVFPKESLQGFAKIVNQLATSYGLSASEAEQQIKDGLNHGFIRPSSPSLAFSILLVKKKMGISARP